MKLKTVILATVAAAAFAAPAMAADVKPTFTVGATSDYIWRGISQNGTNGAAFGNVDVADDNFYAGAGVINSKSGKYELDVYGGYKAKVGPVGVDLGVITYNYPGKASNNLTEIKGAASYKLPYNIDSTLALYVPTNDNYTYTELGFAAPLGKLAVGPFALSGAASYGLENGNSSSAHKNSGVDSNYTNWKLAVIGATKSGYKVEAGYTDTNIKKAKVNTSRYTEVDPSGYVTVSKTF